jgi:hypothetical protein
MRRVATPFACSLAAAAATRGLKQMPQKKGQQQKGNARQSTKGKGKEKATQPAERNPPSSENDADNHLIDNEAKSKVHWEQWDPKQQGL